LSNSFQRILIILVTILVAFFGTWYLQREWISRDPKKIHVDPEVEQQVLTLLDLSKEVTVEGKLSIYYEIRSMGPATTPVLVRALDNKDPEICSFALSILKYSDNPSVIPYVEEKLRDESPMVRKTALIALGNLGAVETIPAIIVVLNDKDKFTRCQAAHVLGVLKDEKAVYSLVKILQQDPYPLARQTAANSLGEIGDEHAVLPLIDSLDDKAPLVRSASLVALNRITGEKVGLGKKAWTDWWNAEHPQ
jgi:HEAT repeat protein